MGALGEVRERRRAPFAVDPGKLPEDPSVLRELVLQLSARGLSMCDRLEQAEDRLYAELLHRYGPRTERTPFDPGQGALFHDLRATEPAEAAPPRPDDQADEKLASPRPHPRKKRNGRRALPPELRREEIVLDLAPEERRCPCCREVMEEFDREVSERLDYKPAELFARRYVRPKYGCRACQEGVLTAELPAEPIRRGLPAAGLLAHLVVAKLADHLPLYRLQGIFARSGVAIPRSTMCDWIREVADLLTPVYDHLCDEIRRGFAMNADETTLPCLDPEERGPGANKRKKRRGGGKQKNRGAPARKGYMWVYLGDVDHPYTVYDYRPNRSRAGPTGFLEGFAGHLLTDDYDGYDEACTRFGITRLACWAHVRRKFFDARSNDRARALVALDLIGELYAIERALHDAAPDERRRDRDERARPVIDRLAAWLEAEQPRTLPKSPIGKAIRYAQRLWPRLLVYLDDGRLPFDNNAAERAVKPLVIGRKNWLFTGSDDGGRRIAVLCSLVESCRRNGIEPFAYLQHLLEVLPGRRGDAADLTPLAWKAAQPAIHDPAEL
jgi:transposase